MEEWRYRTVNLSDLGIRWSVVSFTNRPLYPQGKSPRYPLDGTLRGPHSRSRLSGEKEHLFPSRESNPALFINNKNPYDVEDR
jgi:hypothetical protein